jgi:hypothetical protein
MLTEQPILITSIVAGAAIPKNRLVDFTGSLSAEGTKPLGVSNAETDSGEMLPVVAQGIALVETAAAISVGAAIDSADDGYAGPHSTGEIVGYALDASTGSGEFIRILLS